MLEQAFANLSGKEISEFKGIIKHYEAKKYSKGKKAALSLLKSQPNHAETQCILALFNCCLEENKEDRGKLDMGTVSTRLSLVCSKTRISLVWSNTRLFLV